MKVIGFNAIGINKGLINIKGNLMSIVKIIVDAGVSVGGTESIKLNEENENAANTIPGIRISKFIPFHNSKKIIPNNKGTVENMLPKMKELHTLPRSIVLMEIGQVIRRSRVFCLVSHGKTTGPIDVEVRKSTIVISPEIIYNGTITLPIVKAKNNIIGKRIPWMTTGPLL
jgi:hypothetical protein